MWVYVYVNKFKTVTITKLFVRRIQFSALHKPTIRLQYDYHYKLLDLHHTLYRIIHGLKGDWILIRHVLLINIFQTDLRPDRIIDKLTAVTNRFHSQIVIDHVTR